MTTKQIAVSWNNVELSIPKFGMTLGLAKGLSTNVTVESTYAYGAGQTPFAMTDGIIGYDDVTLTLNFAEYVALEDAIGRPNFYKTKFDVVCNITMEDDEGNTAVHTRTLRSCRIHGNPLELTQGSEPIEVPLVLKHLGIA